MPLILEKIKPLLRTENLKEEDFFFQWISSWTASTCSPWLCFSAASVLSSEAVPIHLYCIHLKDRILIPYTFGSGIDIFPQFSPDHQQILFTSTRTTATQLYFMRTFGGEACPLLASDQTLVAPFYSWAPQGNKILATLFQKNAYHFGGIDFWTRQWVPLLENSLRPPLQAQIDFSGELLYYWISESSEETSCYSMTLSTRKQEKVFSVPGNLVSWSLSPQKKFAFITSLPNSAQWQLFMGNGKHWKCRWIPAIFSWEDSLLMAQVGFALGIPIWNLEESAIFYKVLEQKILKLGKIPSDPAQEIQFLSANADVIYFSSPKPNLLFYYQLGMEDLGTFRQYEANQKFDSVLFRLNEAWPEKKRIFGSSLPSKIIPTLFHSIFQALNSHERLCFP
ncbi:MAG: hypothetical protein AABZ60_04735 [Planctomycetota bacterium]